ncbi:hypothetical protein SLS60_005516 [Paraconiothyrium brasiliense]|uniref:Hypervirulence associated protein TUDOR domain-containing protein n=1 Tax=Paraconiothyrium brasiliense TaxID=300254 RepID=A0ABR3RHK8_9PLEO
MPSKDDKYTDPELRNEVKEEIQAGDKGGAPGQWSARKAQMMASEYKQRGGGYTTDEKDDKAKHLDSWTKEEWQTKEGSGNAKQEDGTEKRYLPKKAWEQMSEKEKGETDQKKQEESKEGKQYVANTSKAKSARKNASKDGEDGEAEPNGHDERKDAKDCTHHWEDEQHMKNGQKAYQDFKKQNGHDEAASEEDQSHSGSAHGDDKEHPTPKKRGSGANATGSNKRQKKGGDKTRVPQVGQKVQWKAISGFVDGEVVEVVYEEKTVDGESVKGSKEDPRIVLKSSSSSKIAVHKPEAVYFD